MEIDKSVGLRIPSRRSYRRRWIWIVGLLVPWMAGCSPYMEATRPAPVDLEAFKIGDTKDSVETRLGIPGHQMTNPDGEKCDSYLLYTNGLNAWERTPIIVLETAADVFTICLAEILMTPTEMLTKNDKYPVVFCYKDDKLASVTKSDTPTPSQN
jgi:hypothetical protein